MKITRKQLRKIILEQMTMAKHYSHESGELDDLSRKKATKELTKTYEWFSEVVFPAIRENRWPVVADDDYYLQVDDIFNMRPDSHPGMIRKGTSWASVDARSNNSALGWTLERLYGALENSVISHDLDVPMESFA